MLTLPVILTAPVVNFTVTSSTTDNSALIAQLQAEIQSLMQQIAALQAKLGKPPVKPIIPGQTCTPNWTCSWGPCTNGYQSQISIDSNNCGVNNGNKIACPALVQSCKPSTQPSITVTSPKAGDSFVVGQATSIQWIGQNMPANTTYNVTIFNGSSTNSPNKTIINGMPVGTTTSGGTTALNWTVEANGTNSWWGLGMNKDSFWDKLAGLFGIQKVFAAAGTNQYVIQVCEYNPSGVNSSVCGVSGVFTINPSNFVLNSPNGGEIYNAGQNMNITWTSGGLLHSDSLNIWLYDYTNGNTPNVTQLATNLPGDTMNYSYLIPNTTSGSKFEVDIEVIRNGTMVARGLSANYFTIVASTSQCSNLYWIDNTTQDCSSQKQFCGSYMYQGLQTFSTQLLCQMGVLQKQLNKTCSSNSDCLSGQVCNSGVCGIAVQPSVQTFHQNPASVNPNFYSNAYDLMYTLNNASSTSDVTLTVGCNQGLTIQTWTILEKLPAILFAEMLTDQMDLSHTEPIL